jgi:F-type H+-transporting ATPase subunit b
LSFLTNQEAYAAESGGMPQLDPEFWISQIFWLTLFFGILYIILSKVILPKISSNLESRKSQILENIEAAEKQRKEADKKIKEYDEIILKGKKEAKEYINQIKKNVLKEVNLKKENLDNQLDDEIQKAENEIKNLKDKAPEKINKIAVDISNELIQKLIGTEINNSSISAIVDELSKKKGNKYI